MKTVLLLVLLLFFAGLAGANAEADLFTEIERLHEQDRHSAILDLVDTELPRTRGNHRRAELLWRKARAQLTLADYGVWSGDLSDRDAIVRLEEAEATAAQAIELAPGSADSYFWKSAAMGLRGQLRGVLNSLFMASDVRDYAEKALERDPDHTEAHYLLGQLYRELPRRPLSFGNRDRAVEFGRRAVQLHEREYRDGVVGVRYYDLYTQLSDSLWRRNNRGDRDESIELLQSLVAELEAVSAPTTRERKDLESARELLSDRVPSR